VLEEAGLVQVSEDGAIQITVAADSIEEQSRSLAGQFETLRTQDGRRLDSLTEYAHSTDCRAVFLRRYFGEDDGTPCGLCDNCRGRPERPSSFWEPIAQPERRKKKRRRTGRRRRPKTGRAAKGAPPAPTTPIMDAGDAGEVLLPIDDVSFPIED
jgi:superfamily II DNA helicase RecQ